MTREASIKVRFTVAEKAAIVRVAGPRGVSEFVRVCANRALAEEGDPEAAKLLAAMFEKGLHQTIERRVKAAIRAEKKKAG